MLPIKQTITITDPTLAFLKDRAPEDWKITKLKSLPDCYSIPPSPEQDAIVFYHLVSKRDVFIAPAFASERTAFIVRTAELPKIEDLLAMLETNHYVKRTDIYAIKGYTLIDLKKRAMNAKGEYAI